MFELSTFSGNPVNIVSVAPKSDAKSKKYREEGNKYYKNGEMNEAIILFNMAINYAESRECLALAFGNRSAAYFTVKKYQECVENIKLARENGYPSDKMSNLDQREDMCLKMMMDNLTIKREDDPQNYFKLSYPANEKIPWIIKDLEMRKTEKYGRGIYTTRELKPGDIICIEEIPITYAIYENLSFFKHCVNCMKMKSLNLIPCTKSASFMFCSNDCREEFYKYSEFSSGEYDSFKFQLNKIESAFGGRQNLEKYLYNTKPGDVSIFDFDFSKATKSEKELYIYESFLASVVPRKPFSDEYKCDRYDSSTNRLITKILKIFQWNMILYSHMNIQENCLSQIQVDNNARVYTTIFGLLNHSCVSNVSYQFVDNKVIIYVSRPIKANSQLFFTHAGDIFEINRKAAIASMDFKCDCVVCIRNLSICDIKPEFHTPMEILATSVKTVGEAIKEVNKNFKIIAKCKKPLSMECFKSQGNVVRMFSLIANKIMLPS